MRLAASYKLPITAFTLTQLYVIDPFLVSAFNWTYNTFLAMTPSWNINQACICSIFKPQLEDNLQ
jgi:hypothetical protein